MGSTEGEKAMDEVKLYGMWASLYSKRVEWALKLKGISYEYVEEDLEKKSEELIKHNPVHNEVPVLVHNGKAITESLLILEYIDETWKDEPALLPADPYMKSKVRFWAHFYDNTVIKSAEPLLWCEDEALEKPMNNHMKSLKVLEEGLKNDFFGGTPYLHGENPGYLDIVLGPFFGSHEATEEAVGVKVLDLELNPTIFKWLEGIKTHPLLKEMVPPHEPMAALLHHVRQLMLSSCKST